MGFKLGQESPSKRTCKWVLCKICLNCLNWDVALEWPYQLLCLLLNQAVDNVVVGCLESNICCLKTFSNALNILGLLSYSNCVYLLKDEMAV